MENLEPLEILKNFGLEVENTFPKTVLQELQKKYTEEKTVIGLDIYHYSKMEPVPQTLIPVIFDLMFFQTEEWMKQYEKGLITQNQSLRDSFIHTGDGGFLLVDNPIVGIVFLLYFYTVLNMYNSGLFMKEYFEVTSEIEVRSCMTKGDVYKYNNNFFGKPIIQNARILASDKLNRFLIDENVNKWFNEKINGITSLSIRTGAELESVLKLPTESLKDSCIFSYTNFINFGDLPINCGTIRHVTKQKIGEISVKDDKNSIYNVEIQRQAEIKFKNSNVQLNNLIVTIGNSNATGLNL